VRADRIVAIEGPSQGIAWRISGTQVLGRAGDIAVPDPLLSRYHCELRTSGGQVRIRHVGATNGAWLSLWGIRRPLGRRWTRLPGKARLDAGAGRYRLEGPPRPSVVRPWGPARVARLAVPLVLVLALAPFAAAGPPSRWLIMAIPLMAAATAGPRPRGYQHRRAERPADILAMASQGRAFHAEAVMPASLGVLQSVSLAGTGWAFTGAQSERHAIWLAGFLAVHNDPDVLRVTSPWLTTAGSGLEVVFEPDPPSGPARDGALVTWHPDRPPAWAAILRPPAWARAAPPWIDALAATTGTSLPARVDLLSLVSADEPSIRARWAVGLSLRVAVGVTESGEVLDLDLVRDGPHALIAGMSGAGKSELLTTWLLALALRNRPELLQYVLVDFKGGAAFDVLHDLPHCAGVLTDLDELATRRALESLRAQLRRRERELRASAARDIAEHNARSHDPLPVLLVVIDEYRALATDHPDLLDQFLRLGNQGRSLGIHLIVATQRPAGAVSPELRANMPLRVCLRVAEPADSLDVLGVPDAAGIENVPGRVLVRGGASCRAQIAWSGDSDHVRELVQRIRGAAAGCRATPPWRPPLPTRVRATGAPLGTFAIADVPEELAQRAVPLPEAGLLILGPTGAGRTTAAHAAVAAALASDDDVWLVSSAPAPVFATSPPSFGGVIDPRQTRLVSQLLDHVTRPARTRRTIVLDDVETWIDTTDALHGAGSASSRLGVLLRSARVDGVRVVVAAQPAHGCARWAEPLRSRLFLSGSDPAAIALAGLSRDAISLLAPTPIPGRGALCPDGLLVQVVLAEATAVRGSPHPARRFVPLPGEARVAPRVDRIMLGYDGCGTVEIPARGDVLIVGPPGSGRSTTALLIRSQHGAATIVDGPVGEHPGPLIVTTTPTAIAATWSGPLARLRNSATLILLRPDLYPRIAGLDYTSELEPGGPGYAIVIHEGSARALRLARTVG